MSIKNDSITFVVPALNEGALIVSTAEEIVKAVGEGREYEILFVDDGSTDDTYLRMQELERKNACVRSIRHEVNKGLGASYKTGVANAEMKHVMMIPGDNQFPSGSIRTILESVGTADVVIPYHRNADSVRTPARRLISDVFTALANLLSGMKIPYYNGTVVHRTDLIRDIEIETDGFAYQLEALVKLLGNGSVSYVTAGIDLVEREGGETKAFSFRNIVQVLEVFYRLLLYRLRRILNAG